MDLGVRIRALRKERGLSLERLADKSDVAVGSLSRIENGKGGGNSRTIERVAEALKLSVAELYRGLEAPPVAEPQVLRGERGQPPQQIKEAGRPGRSRPQSPVLTPVRTTSRKPAAISRSSAAATSSAGVLRESPRTVGMMQ